MGYDNVVVTINGRRCFKISSIQTIFDTQLIAKEFLEFKREFLNIYAILRKIIIKVTVELLSFHETKIH